MDKNLGFMGCWDVVCGFRVKECGVVDSTRGLASGCGKILGFRDVDFRVKECGVVDSTRGLACVARWETF